MYQVYTANRRVEKEIRDLEKSTRDRVIQALRNLAQNPRPQGARKLGGKLRGAWRIRVGSYRILYDIDDDEHAVIILAVLHHREAYR